MVCAASLISCSCSSNVGSFVAVNVAVVAILTAVYCSVVAMLVTVSSSIVIWCSSIGNCNVRCSIGSNRT